MSWDEIERVAEMIRRTPAARDSVMPELQVKDLREESQRVHVRRQYRDRLK